MTDHPGHSVLLVPVAPLEPFVRARTQYYDPAYVSTDAAFVHAHVTVLGPFLTPDLLDKHALATISEIASATASFEFIVEKISTFPNGVVHLVPEPDEPFRLLTATLCDAFPECPPYAGAFPDVVPHVTLDALSGEVTEDSTREAVSPWLPARCWADRLDLAWYEPRRSHVVRSWRLGVRARDATCE